MESIQMAGNLVSLCAVTCATSRYIQPEYGFTHFHNLSFHNTIDKQCPNCKCHITTKTRNKQKCPFCYTDLPKRSKRKKSEIGSINYTQD